MSINQPIEIRKERNFGEIISVTFEFIRKNFKLLFKSIVFIPGPFYLLGALIFISYSFGFTNPASQQDMTNFYGNFLLSMSGFVLLGLGAMILMLTVNEIIVLQLKYGREEINLKLLIGKIKKSFWNYVGAAVLLTIIGMIGFLFFIIPGIYFMVALSFVLMIISAEGKMFGDAIGRSFAVIKGNWWNTFGLLIVVSLIQGLIAYTLMLPFLVLSSFSFVLFDPVTPDNLVGYFSIFQVVFMATYYVIIMFVSVIPMIAIAFKYFSIVENKEEVGLREKIMQMGTETEK